MGSKRRKRQLQKRKKIRKAARQQERAQRREEESVERRGLAVDVTEIGGVPVDEPTQMVLIEPIRLPAGDLYFESPFVVPFYLLKAKTLRDAAEPKRIQSTRDVVTTPDNTLRPRNPSVAFDALEDLALAVILSAAAIEAHANDMIGRLPDNAMVEVPRRVAGETIR
jgi:hypothetical protein